MASEFVVQSSHISRRTSPAWFLLSNILRHPLILGALLVGAFSNAALASAMPYFIGMAFNSMNEMLSDPAIPVSLDFAALMTLAIIGSQLLRSILQFIRNFSAEIYAQRVERDIRDELYASLLGKSMAFHDMQPVGEIMARVTNDVREVNFFMNPGINLVVGSSMFLLLPVIVAPAIHPQLILVPLTFVLAHLVVQVRFVRMLHPIAQNVRQQFGSMNARLAEALEGVQVVKGGAQEAAESRRFNKLAEDVRDRYIEQGEVEARYFSTLLMGLTFPAGLVHALLLYNQGAINSGDIVAFIGQIYLFMFPVFSSPFSLARMASGYASAGRILRIINATTDLDRNQNGRSEPISGSITFEGVDFSYLEGKQVLHDISFSIRPGQTVAIVGQTGSGKSTITKLINRIYDTDSGRVLIDGVDVREWDLQSLRSQISVIEQDIFLFSRSIEENIAFGSESHTREAVEDAAQKAQAHEFIMSFPDGYNTVVGQRGVTLSGGQRQRLAIARAFHTDPPILILDDSTSAIDSATEDLIQQAIWAAARGRTTILITHRLSQIRWADHIIVLREGRVVAQGSHDELLSSSESYRRIFARYETPEQDGAQDEVSKSDALETGKQQG